MNFKLSIIILLAGIAVIFIVQNAAVTQVQFLVWSAQVSLALLIFLLLAVGFIAGWFLHSFVRYRQVKARKTLTTPAEGSKEQGAK
ncbi:MAG: DUF1049 domain-containing protein [Desulfuromonas sp.]|jgi:uncharacterized integral membrane protein|nr:MAG: DUF1049 domain-containing protein [Desulfuromonas sp.]